jgi:hypothetical protein
MKKNKENIVINDNFFSLFRKKIIEKIKLNIGAIIIVPFTRGNKAVIENTKKCTIISLIETLVFVLILKKTKGIKKSKVEIKVKSIPGLNTRKNKTYNANISL